MLELYDSLNDSAVLVPRQAGLASVTGPDRVQWLQGMVSNDVAALAPGRGCYAAHLDSRGKVLALMRVLADADALWLELDQDVASSVAALDRLLIMEDAELADRSGESTVLTLVGARARAALEGWARTPLDLPDPYAHRLIEGIRVVRADIGYDLIVPDGTLDSVRGRLEEQGVSEAGSELWDLLTLEAGLPRYGMDVDSTTTLPELGENGIDYGKGCYIGQEVVAKIRYLGHVNRHFVGFRFSTDRLPDFGAVVRRGDRPVGTVTRAGDSPSVGGIALGFVRRGSEAPGTEVEILAGEGALDARVAEIPFLVRSWD